MKLITVHFRPLLTSGSLGTDAARRIHMFVDTEQPELEQLRSLCHETMHLLGVQDDAAAEILARRMAAALGPEFLLLVKAAHA